MTYGNFSLQKTSNYKRFRWRHFFMILPFWSNPCQRHQPSSGFKPKFVCAGTAMCFEDSPEQGTEASNSVSDRICSGLLT